MKRTLFGRDRIQTAGKGVSYDQRLTFPFRSTLEIWQGFSRIVGQAYLIRHTAMQLATLFIGIYIKYTYIENMLYIIGNDLEAQYQKLGSGENQTGRATGNINFYNYIWTIVKFLVYISGSFVVSFAITHFDRKFNKQLSRKVEDVLIEKKYSDQKDYTLSHNRKLNQISKNLHEIGNDFVENGSRVLSNGYRAFCSFSVAGHVLFRHSSWVYLGPIPVLDLVTYSSVYGFLTLTVSGYLITRKHTYAKNIKLVQEKSDDIGADNDNNRKNINLSDGRQYTKKRYEKFIATIREDEDKQSLFLNLHSAWHEIRGNLSDAGKYAILGYKLCYKDMNPVIGPLALSAINNAETFFTWPERNFDDIKNAKRALDRMHAYLDEFDRIVMQRAYPQSPDATLVFENFKLTIGDRKLIDIAELRLPMLDPQTLDGKRYLILGSNGSGKSALFSKIKGLQDPSFMQTDGTIYLPTINGKQAYIVMLPQTPYFPKHTTLLEAFCFPKNSPQEPRVKTILKAKIEKLLKLADIDSQTQGKTHHTYDEQDFKERHENKDSGYSIDTPTSKRNSIIDLLNNEVTYADWNDRLSGGQKKKILLIKAILQAILKRPDILILDEAFNEVDIPAKKALQQLIMENLPKTMVININHEGEKDQQINGKYFCDTILELKNGRFSMRPAQKSWPQPGTQAPSETHSQPQGVQQSSLTEHLGLEKGLPYQKPEVQHQSVQCSLGVESSPSQPNTLSEVQQSLQANAVPTSQLLISPGIPLQTPFKQVRSRSETRPSAFTQAKRRTSSIVVSSRQQRNQAGSSLTPRAEMPTQPPQQQPAYGQLPKQKASPRSRIESDTDLNTSPIVSMALTPSGSPLSISYALSPSANPSPRSDAISSPSASPSPRSDAASSPSANPSPRSDAAPSPSASPSPIIRELSSLARPPRFRRGLRQLSSGFSLEGAHGNRLSQNYAHKTEAQKSLMLPSMPSISLPPVAQLSQPPSADAAASPSASPSPITRKLSFSASASLKQPGSRECLPKRHFSVSSSKPSLGNRPLPNDTCQEKAQAVFSSLPPPAQSFLPAAGLVQVPPENQLPQAERVIAERQVISATSASLPT